MRKILITLMVLSGLLMADETNKNGFIPYDKLSDVDKKLFDRVHSHHNTNMAEIKSLIEAGGNKNLVIDKDGEKLLSGLARRSSSPFQAEAISYLSSIGADSYGMDNGCENGYGYDKPRVFETKHLKLTIFGVNIEGGARLLS